MLMGLLLLAVALIFGGGSRLSPQSALVVEAVAALVLLAAVALPDEAPLPRGATAALLLVGAIVLLPLIQLLPLPASAWSRLPGRELAGALLDAGGVSRGAAHLTLDSESTRRSAIGLVAPIAMFLVALRTTARARRTLARSIVAGAFASLLLGAVQVSNGTGFYPYDNSDVGYPVGFFANRNHFASLLVVAIALVPVAAGGRSRTLASRGGILAVIALLATGIVLSASRAGLLLLPLALASALLQLLDRSGKRGWILLIAALGLGLLAALGIAFNPVVQHSALRFLQLSGEPLGSDLRVSFWRGTLLAARAFWPTGSGLGTFVPVFQTIEPLETILPAYVNHAHNDYLELLLETGAPGMLLIAAALLLIVRQALRSAAPVDRIQRNAALTGIAILLLHGMVDYPLRTLTLSSLFGFLCACLFPSAEDGLRPINDRANSARARSQ